MKSPLILLTLLSPLLVFAEPPETISALSPEESMKTFEIPDGFRLECVASEPMVQEPASFAFDGEGAMYVCEWRTYMQDEHATGQSDLVSRVVKLVDTDGDGKMDKRTVFIDKVLLPRTVLPMQDYVLVNLTGSNSVWAYYDDDYDGVSDRRELVFDGKDNKGNIEHQASGLVWNLDNYIDTNYERLSYNNGKLVSTPHSAARISQWGLTRDDNGHLYGTWAGGGNPAHSFQLPAGYPIVKINEHAEGYDLPYSICSTHDESSGGFDFENNRVLIEFSAPGGQSFIRSEVMGDLEGLMISPEPVGRLIRGTRFERSGGLAVAHNATPGAELIRSSDTFFRPVWSEVGPDGCLYFSDMYRGIIQEKTWFPTEGEHPWVARYHRVRDWGMLKVFRHGRIYRLVPEGRELDPKPDMLSQSSEELVAHLDHGNGWWRDQAQKLIVTRGGETAVPALLAMVENPGSDRALVNALWTLEGLGKLEKGQIIKALESESTTVKLSGIRLAEPYLAKGDAKVAGVVEQIASSDDDQQVVIQLINSYSRSKAPKAKDMVAKLEASHPDNPIMVAIEANRAEKKQVAAMGASAKRGAAVYEAICTTCHGKDGYGVYAEGKLLAPSLRNSPLFSKGETYDRLIARVLLDGMMGPLRGQTYGEGIMIPFKDVYSDEQISDVVNYIGSKWHRGRWKKSVVPQTIAEARKETSGRAAMWTEEELGQEAKDLGMKSPYGHKKAAQ